MPEQIKSDDGLRETLLDHHYKIKQTQETTDRIAETLIKIDTKLEMIPQIKAEQDGLKRDVAKIEGELREISQKIPLETIFKVETLEKDFKQLDEFKDKATYAFIGLLISIIAEFIIIFKDSY